MIDEVIWSEQLRVIPMQVDHSPHIVKFGTFELDLRARELHKNGLKISLPEQSIQILAMLLERPGGVVTREEIQAKLWPDDTIVEFDHSINAAVKRLRQALGDSADNPRYVETLARRGYRFIAPADVRPGPGFPTSDPRPPERSEGVGPTVGVVAPGLAPAEGVQTAGAPVHSAREIPECRPARPWTLRLMAIAAMLLVGAVMGWFVWHRFEHQATQVVPGTIRSLAVLPLDNLSGDPQQEYFADGMTDALIAELGQIAALRVISRTSVMRYKGTKKALPEIARELGVDAIAEGSVVREGNRVRIIAQLVEGKTDRHLWAHTYDRDLTSVLASQGEVAQAIANEINIKVTRQEQARLAAAGPVNPEAHELYLRGNDWLMRENRQKGFEYFQQAIQKDANFARAYLGVAKVYNSLGMTGDLPSVEVYGKAKEYARRALELDESLDEAHVALGYTLYSGDWDWPGAEREIRRALEINPNSESAHNRYSVYLALLGRHEEAIAEARHLQEISPQAGPYLGLGVIYYFARRYDEALAQYAQYQKSPLEDRNAFFHIDRNTFFHICLAWVYREKGMYKEALGEFSQMPDEPPKFGHRGNAYARVGNKAEARKDLQKLIEMSRHNIGTYEVAQVYAGLGEKDRAFEWLEKAYKIHDKSLTFLKVDPCLDPLRSDPRFQDLLRRVGLPP